MKIAIIGGGASGMVSAYLLDQQGHEVTVFERQPILGGHIRTLNKNVQPNHSHCREVLENGVLEFPSAFHNFLALMQNLNVELEQVDLGSGLFLPPSLAGKHSSVRHILSGALIRKNFTGLRRLLEYWRLDGFYARAAVFWLRMQLPKMQDFYDQPMSLHLPDSSLRNNWLKLLTMYSYSMPFEQIDNFPAELAIPALRQYIFAKWFRIKGGVYSYIEKILARFGGTLRLNAQIKGITRSRKGVTLELPEGTQRFDKVVFATPPDQVLKLLADPTEAESKCFLSWLPNYVQTVLHSDTAMYQPYGITAYGEFDFFCADSGWGYNAALNQLCGITAKEHYSLAFNLDSLIAPEKILHVQSHHTPYYAVESFHWRDEIIATNGENNTYHAGAYLADGLHEGAVTSAMRVAQLVSGESSAPEQLTKSDATAAQPRRRLVASVHE
jgi:uncharacterized protein